MLTYHPAFDIYHCAYRTLLLLTKTQTVAIEAERIRIWDFYYVFPQESLNISFPRTLWSLKKSSLSDPNTYEKLTDPQRIFERMKPFQLAALNYLAAYGFIESDALSQQRVKRTSKLIPQDLLANMERIDSQQEYIISLISSPLNNIPLYGEKGFKDRTKLLDFRYDPR